MKTLLTLTALLGLNACATITADSQQEITVSTNPSGASCLLHSDEGQWTVASTPGAANVERAFTLLEVTCTLSGYEPGHTTLTPQTRGRAYGNILLGGVPAVVDAGTGKGYEYSPYMVDVQLVPVKR
ncbi:MAG: hypothetical protein ACOYNL_07810 [Rickettsiales bacterium]